METKDYAAMYDWSETLSWLRNARNPEPGGWEGDDLFDMPLPEGFEEDYKESLQGAEWTFAPYWGEQDEPSGAMWQIGATGWWVVIPCCREPFIMAPDGTYIE